METKTNKHFLGFAGSHFSYFFIWAIVYGYLTLWLEDIAGLNGAEAGILFSLMAGISLFFQPVFGIVSDKLGFKKTLLAIIAIAAIFIGPFFQWFFLPILEVNTYLGIIIAGIYLSFILNGGVGVIEQYIERASWVNKFEYGHSRLGGSIAGATASFLGGQLFIWQPNAIFWACSLSAVLLTILVVFFDKVNLSEVDNSKTENNNKEKINTETVLAIFKMTNFWALAFFFVGAAALYDVFDQQFLIYFQTFFTDPDQGTLIYSYTTSTQIALEVLLMIPMPYIINKIGAKKGLLIFGAITFIRIFGSAVAPSYEYLVVFRLLAGLEMPLLLVSVMKYIDGAFDRTLYATIYMFAFNFAKQISVFIFSTASGQMYESLGFSQTYFILSGIVFIITIISIFTLKENKVKLKQ
ncbi:MAG: oligosaccharide MFS transporter [Mycoplasmatales bacterium]